MGTNGRHPLVDQAYQTRHDGDRRGALALYMAAAEALKGVDAVAEASALRHAADLHAELGEPEAAGQTYSQAWALYAALDPAPVLDQANCRRPMALWQEQNGDRAHALGLWREARGLYERAAVATGLDLQPAYEECDRHIADLSG